MPGLEKSEVSLRDYPTGLNVVIFDVDPNVFDPFNAPIRGTSIKVLDGTVVHEVFGHRQKDFVIQLQGQITETDTLTALWTKYRNGGGGVEQELRDWMDNRWVVQFTPGIDSFHPTPIPGSCTGFNYTMSLSVCEILQWFGGVY